MERAGPKQLDDGTIGYFVRAPREDDCFAAALATVLQVPIEQVPDPRIDERLAAGESPDDIDRSARSELDRWLAARDLTMVVHAELPTHRRRWIGVVTLPGAFNDHCLVMSHDRFLFDPVHYLEHLTGQSDRHPSIRQFRPEDISYGLSFTARRKARR